MSKFNLKPHQLSICLTYAAICKLSGELPTVEQIERSLQFKTEPGYVRDYLLELAGSSEPAEIAQGVVGVIRQLATEGDPKETAGLDKAVEALSKAIA